MKIRITAAAALSAGLLLTACAADDAVDTGTTATTEAPADEMGTEEVVVEDEATEETVTEETVTEEVVVEDAATEANSEG
jgi:ABC-type glycerol-3-phosphate transport system substrate-binding protein